MFRKDSTIVLMIVGGMLVTAIPAHGFGERFKLERTGTQYCGDFDASKLTTKNSADLWAEIFTDSAGTALHASTSADFLPGTTFLIFGDRTGSYSV